VHPVDIPVQDAMRSIISCGAGTQRLVQQHLDIAGIEEVLKPNSGG
jgi:uncharacterized membrane protein